MSIQQKNNDNFTTTTKKKNQTRKTRRFCFLDDSIQNIHIIFFLFLLLHCIFLLLYYSVLYSVNKFICMLLIFFSLSFIQMFNGNTIMLCEFLVCACWLSRGSIDSESTFIVQLVSWFHFGFDLLIRVCVSVVRCMRINRTVLNTQKPSISCVQFCNGLSMPFRICV